MKKTFLFSSLILISTYLGCSAKEEPKLPVGRCQSHVDCLEGNKCVKTRCQDIYHPQAEIKNY